MYCHDLRAAKDGESFQIPCEDSPASEGLVGIWPYELKMDSKCYVDMISALHAWAAHEGLNYRLYVTPDRFETGPAVNNQAEQVSGRNGGQRR